MDLFRFFNRIVVAAYCGIGLLALTVTAAIAQDAPLSTVVNIAPFAQTLLELFMPLALVIATMLVSWIARRIAVFLGLKIDERHRAAIEQGMIRTADLVRARLTDYTRGGIPIDMRSQAIAMGVEIAQRAFPAALKHFGASGERIAEMFEARLEGSFVGDEPSEVKTLSRAITGPVPV